MFSLTAYRSLILSTIFFMGTLSLHAAPGNDDCATATLLTSAVTCSNTPGTLSGATNSGVAINSACGGQADDDVWYKFIAVNQSITITLSGINNGNGKLGNATPTLELLSGTCGSLSSLACDKSNANSITYTALTAGATYYIRVYSGAAGFPANDATFSICITHAAPPANDECTGAIALTSGTANSSGTLWGASTSSSIPVGCATGTPDDDVWYRFTSTGTIATISLSNVGTNLSSSGAMIQLFSGTCGALTSVDCGSTTINATGLTNGSTYYIRVYSSGAGFIGGTSTGASFSITFTGPTTLPQTTVGSGRMNEVFKQTTLSASGGLQYPWEITYGPDNNLWITESRGYRVWKMDPNTGVKTTVLDLNSTSADLSAWGADSLRAVNLTSQSNWNTTASAWPQGGLAGLAIHPKFSDGTGLYDFVYVSYVHRFLSTASGSAGIFFRNKIVRFTYNSATGKLGSPAVVCDTIPGGQDHNSQRMIIAPVTAGGTNYLFYAGGDMGAGQFANRLRPQNAQNTDSYEGKILRFNLEPDSDGDETVPNAWIPGDNPYNTMLAKQSAVYSIGIRNNQGFAFDTATNKLYGSSHGPYSDDEINIIEGFRNYGHPLIEGFADGNYNGNSAQGTTTSISAGAPYTDNLGVSTCPPIGNEVANKAAIDASGKGLYKDPLFSAYAIPLGDLSTPGTVAYIWRNNPGNASPAPGWPTEAWAGLDLYSNKLIPGWKRSLVAASLKWGRLVRLKLDAAGTATAPSNTVNDTVTYFNSQNRFRDIAFSSDGKDIFVVMDNNSTTSGPGSANPVVPSCAGCVQKYTFLGYNTGATGRSMIPTSIDVTAGTANTCEAGTTITIDNTNNNLWVPITGSDGNIMAEIKANGNNLGTVTSSFYTNAGTVRENALQRLYLDRNLTITPQTQPSTPVSIRLYLTANELNALKNASNSKGSSGVTSIGNISIYKNNDVCGAAWTNTATPAIVAPTYAEAHGSNGFVLQADVSSFSSFYFANTNAITLPLQLLTFTGSLKDKEAHLLWKTANEANTSHFIVERSLDGSVFTEIGKVESAGNSNSTQNYTFTDKEAGYQPSLTVYYRLKMFDLNASFSYSKVITVFIEPSASIVTIYPNPVHSVLKAKVSLTKADKLQVIVTDMNGHTIYSSTKHISTGTTELEIDTKGWPAQLYSVKITDRDNKILVIKNILKL